MKENAEQIYLKIDKSWYKWKLHWVNKRATTEQYWVFMEISSKTLIIGYLPVTHPNKLAELIKLNYTNLIMEFVHFFQVSRIQDFDFLEHTQ